MTNEHQPQPHTWDWAKQNGFDVVEEESCTILEVLEELPPVNPRNPDENRFVTMYAETRLDHLRGQGEWTDIHTTTDFLKTQDLSPENLVGKTINLRYRRRADWQGGKYQKVVSIINED